MPAAEFEVVSPASAPAGLLPLLKGLEGLNLSSSDVTALSPTSEGALAPEAALLALATAPNASPDLLAASPDVSAASPDLAAAAPAGLLPLLKGLEGLNLSSSDLAAPAPAGDNALAPEAALLALATAPNASPDLLAASPDLSAASPGLLATAPNAASESPLPGAASPDPAAEAPSGSLLAGEPVSGTAADLTM